MKWQWALSPVVTLIASPAIATTYLSVEQAQQAIFPGVVLTPHLVALTDSDAAQITQRSGIPVTSRLLRSWRGANGEWFIVDAVVGKHELISYALGITPQGSVKQVEILEYREAYGQEVRTPAWRQQFVGKTSGDTLTVGQDIHNISGATLSSRHVTDGIKRLMATYALVLHH